VGERRGKVRGGWRIGDTSRSSTHQRKVGGIARAPHRTAPHRRPQQSSSTHLGAHDAALAGRDEAAAVGDGDASHRVRVPVQERLRAIEDVLDDDGSAERLDDMRTIRVPAEAVGHLACGTSEWRRGRGESESALAKGARAFKLERAPSTASFRASRAHLQSIITRSDQTARFADAVARSRRREVRAHTAPPSWASLAEPRCRASDAPPKPMTAPSSSRGTAEAILRARARRGELREGEVINAVAERANAAHFRALPSFVLSVFSRAAPTLF
jgi:hypothetical protein